MYFTFNLCEEEHMYFKIRKTLIKNNQKNNVKLKTLQTFISCLIGIANLLQENRP